MTAAPITDFTIPNGRVATAPPEERGLVRDQVSLLVARPERITHTTFRHLGAYLSPGDAVVVNTSATRRAAIDGRRGGRPVVVHLSNRLDSGRWVIELRRRDGDGPILDATPGERIELEGGGLVVLDAPVTPGENARLWRGTIGSSSTIEEMMARHGRPITYGYVDKPWPLSAYQTVFARPDDPTGASAEMPSAGRPFTPHLVAGLVSRGVLMVPVVLHAGVSSLERHEPPPTEPYEVPAVTAATVNAARRRGNRVVAIGTTVARALETATDTEGIVRPKQGWTDLVLGPDRPARLVNGLVTGWHPPEASHLLLLEAVAGAELVGAAYRAAVDGDYLWHEFGDSSLFLP